MSALQALHSPNLIETSCYGLHQIAPENLQADAAAVMEVLSLLEGEGTPAREHANSPGFQVAHRLLSSVAAQTGPSWVSISEMFGHPAPELARKLALSMNNLSRSIKQQDHKRYMALIEQFDNDRGFEALDSFLDVALRGEPPVGEDKMAYILKTPGKFSLQIGACSETLRDFLANMIKGGGYSQQRPEILGAWLIHDAEEVQAAISEAFKTEAMPDGSYFIADHKAKPMLEALLKHTNNFVLSPWHIEDEPSAVFRM